MIFVWNCNCVIIYFFPFSFKSCKEAMFFSNSKQFQIVMI